MLMLLIIFVVFTLSYIPFVIINKFDPCYTMPYFHILAYVINWTSVVINPVIYVITQRSYQDALDNLFRTIKTCSFPPKNPNMSNATFSPEHSNAPETKFGNDDK